MQIHDSYELSLLDVNLPEVTDIPVICFHKGKELISSTYGQKITDYEDFEPEEEKLLSEIILKDTGSGFVFVTHYPAVTKPKTYLFIHFFTQSFHTTYLKLMTLH